MYNNCSAKLGVEAAPTVELRRGVKQGDLLSPILFKLAMDPLISQLEHGGDGFTVDTDGTQQVRLKALPMT